MPNMILFTRAGFNLFLSAKIANGGFQCEFSLSIKIMSIQVRTNLFWTCG